MADNEIDIRILAQTGDVEAGTQRAAKAVSDMASQLEAQYRGSADAAQELYNAVGRVSGAAQESTASIAAAASAFSRTSAAGRESVESWNKAAASFKEAGAGARALGAAGVIGATGMRELIVIGHEIVSGRFSRIPGSLMVLASRMGGLGSVIGVVSSSWFPFIAGGAAAAGALGYVGYQAIQTANSLRQVQDAMAFRGYGGQQTFASLRQEMSQLQSSYDLSNTAARHLMTTFSDLTGVAAQYVNQIRAVASGIGSFSDDEKDSEKAIEQFHKAIEGGTESLVKYALANQLMGSVQAQVLEDLAKGGDIGAFKQALDIITTAVDKHGAALHRDAAAMDEWMRTSAMLGAEGAYSGLPMPEKGFVNRHAYERQNVENPQYTKDTDQIKEGNKVFHERVVIQERIANLQRAMAEAEAQLADQRGGDSATTTALNERIAQAQRAIQNEQIALSKLHDPYEQREHELKMDHLQQQLQLAEKQPQRQVEIRKQMVDEEAKYAGAGSPEAAKEENAKVAAERHAQEEQLQAQVEGIRARAAEERRGAQERVSDQNEILKILIDANAKGLASDKEVAAQRVQVASAEREARRMSYEEFSADERLKVQTAKGSSAEIIAIYDEWLAHIESIYGKDAPEYKNVQREKVVAAQQAANEEFRIAETEAKARIQLEKETVDQIIQEYNRLNQLATQTGQPPTVKAQLARDEEADLKRKQQELFSQAEQANASQMRLDGIREQQFRASLQIQVAQHRLTKAQMEAAEQQYTANIMAQEEQRLELMVANDNLTTEQKQKVYEQLADLYAKDAEKFTEAQAKITEDIQKENEERLKSFKQFFDSVESGLENMISGALTRQKNVLRSFIDSMIKSATQLGTHLLSQMAGKGLASALNINMEGEKDTGLGAVLTKAFGSMFGLSKEAPQDKGQIAQQKLAQAAAAQEKAAQLAAPAADSLKKAGDELQKAAQMLQGKSGGTGTGTGTGAGTAEGTEQQTPSAFEGQYTQSTSSNIPAGREFGTGASLADRIAFYRQYASSKGLNPDAIAATVMGEGGSGYRGDLNKATGQYTSFGDFQLHTPGGMGVLAQRAGIDVTNPATWQAQGRFAIDQMAVNRGGGAGWFSSQFHGAPPWAAASFNQPGGSGAGQRVQVDPGSVAQGVQQGMQQSQQQGRSQGATAANQNEEQLISANQRLDQATQQDSSAVDKSTQSTDQDKDATDKNTEAVKQLNDTLQQKNNQQGSGSGSSGSGSSDSTDTSSSSSSSSSGLNLGSLSGIMSIVGPITSIASLFSGGKQSSGMQRTMQIIGAATSIFGLLGKLFGGGDDKSKSVASAASKALGGGGGSNISAADVANYQAATQGRVNDIPGTEGWLGQGKFLTNAQSQYIANYPTHDVTWLRQANLDQAIKDQVRVPGWTKEAQDQLVQNDLAFSKALPQSGFISDNQLTSLYAGTRTGDPTTSLFPNILGSSASQQVMGLDRQQMIQNFQKYWGGQLPPNAGGPAVPTIPANNIPQVPKPGQSFYTYQPFPGEGQQVPPTPPTPPASAASLTNWKNFQTPSSVPTNFTNENVPFVGGPYTRTDPAITPPTQMPATPPLPMNQQIPGGVGSGNMMFNAPTSFAPPPTTNLVPGGAFGPQSMLMDQSTQRLTQNFQQLTSSSGMMNSAFSSMQSTLPSVTSEFSQLASAGGGGGGFGGILGDVAGAGFALFERGGIVSAAGGMVVGGSGGGSLAVLHPKEMVLPANISTGIQNMIASNDNSSSGTTNNFGGDTHVHLSSLDSRTGAQWLMSNKHHVAAAMAGASRGFATGTGPFA